jgi:hypothetical protein
MLQGIARLAELIQHRNENLADTNFHAFIQNKENEHRNELKETGRLY